MGIISSGGGGESEAPPSNAIWRFLPTPPTQRALGEERAWPQIRSSPNYATIGSKGEFPNLQIACVSFV